jgi:LysR family transcriptional activator of glutamate synthase operon
MELRQLVYFEAVVRHGGFTHAAEHLHIAQPAVSAQVKRLEHELGTPLLARTTRRVALTHAGELFLIRVREVLAQLDGARADLAELADVLRGNLRIGATLVLGSLDLPGLLADFHRRHPGVTLALRTGLVAELLGDLDAGCLDVVVGPLHPELLARCTAEPLVAERLVLVTALGRAEPVTTLADVRDEPFVCLRAGSGLHSILLASAEAEGFTPHVPFETHSPASIRELVAAGLGVALLAESAARAVGPAVRVHVLDPSPEHPPIGVILARDRPRTAVATAWLHHLAEATIQS